MHSFRQWSTIPLVDDDKPVAGGYSQDIAVGDFVFTAGMGPADPVTGDIVGGNDVAEQTRQVLRNLSGILVEIDLVAYAG